MHLAKGGSLTKLTRRRGKPECQFANYNEKHPWQDRQPPGRAAAVKPGPAASGIRTEVWFGRPQRGLSAGRVCRPERPLPWGVMVPPGRACPWPCFHVEPSGQKAKMCGPRASAGACVSALTLQLAELDSQELAVSLVPSWSYTLNQGPAHARHPDKR